MHATINSYAIADRESDVWSVVIAVAFLILIALFGFYGFPLLKEGDDQQADTSIQIVAPQNAEIIISESY